MEEAIRKSDVLIEALPYIKSYSGRVFVIKYGGSALVNPEIKHGVLEDIVFMSYVGIRPILVHGGGPFINEELKKERQKIQFKDGLRVTTKENMEVVDRVLTRLNLELKEEIRSLGGRAVSLNAKEKGVIKATPHKDRKMGFAGEASDVNIDDIKKAVRPRSVPIISPVGVGADGAIYNVNADEASSIVASKIKAVKLVLLTDVKGIMRENDDGETLISTLTMKEAEMLIEKKVIHGGMIPKVKACINALHSGVQKTHIIDGRIPHSLLLEIFTDRGIGTEIVLDKAKR